MDQTPQEQIRSINRRIEELKQKKYRALKYNISMNKYRRDPLLWLEERFKEDRKSFQWSLYDEYKNHKWDGDIDPLAQAWNDVANKKWVAIRAGTATSKTYWLSRLVFWFLDVYENSLVVTSAPKFDQVRFHIWSELKKEFHRFKKIRPTATLTNTALRVNAMIDGIPVDTWHAIGFVSGTGTEEQSATKAQGFHRENMLIILDETPGMRHAVLTAFENTSTASNNIIVAVGNPDSPVDPLAVFGNKPSVNSYRVSAYDYPNIVLKKELIAGAVTMTSIANRKKDYGEDSDFYKSRVRGLVPLQSDKSLIKLSWLEEIINYDIDPDPESLNALGVDVANSEQGDKACLARGEENVLREINEFFCPNASHLAYNLIYDDIALSENGYIDYEIDTLEGMGITPDCVGVDSVGIGLSTLQTLENEGYIVESLQGGQDKDCLSYDEQTGKPRYEFSSLRAQMYWQLREDIRNKDFAIWLKDKLSLQRLKENVIVPRYKIKGGKISVEPKEEIKKRMHGKSPNDIDALVYWNWVRKDRQGFRGGMHT